MKNKKFAGALLIVAALVLVIYAFMELDAESVEESFKALEPIWILMIIGCMVLYYVFDALKFMIVSDKFGFKQSFKESFIVSMLGFFYSAATPLSTGGQPFQIVHMHNNGMKASQATSVICMTFLMWKSALVLSGLVGLITIIIGVIEVSEGWILMLFFGLLVQISALSAMLISAIAPRFTINTGVKCIKWFYGVIEFITRKHADHTNVINKWDDFVTQYNDSFRMGFGYLKEMIAAFLIACLQLMAYMSVAYCTYRGFGMNGQPYFRIMLIQVAVYIGASFWPMPGGSGATEAGFMIIYKNVFGNRLAMSMLVWRLATYYLTLLVGYLVVVFDRVDKTRNHKETEITN